MPADLLFGLDQGLAAARPQGLEGKLEGPWQKRVL
jgi:hypothetical protein